MEVRDSCVTTCSARGPETGISRVSGRRSRRSIQSTSVGPTTTVLFTSGTTPSTLTERLRGRVSGRVLYRTSSRNTANDLLTHQYSFIVTGCVHPCSRVKSVRGREEFPGVDLIRTGTSVGVLLKVSVPTGVDGDRGEAPTTRPRRETP